MFETTCQTTLTCANIDPDHEKTNQEHHEYQPRIPTSLHVIFVFLIIIICSMTFSGIYFAHQIKEQKSQENQIVFHFGGLVNSTSEKDSRESNAK